MSVARALLNDLYEAEDASRLRHHRGNFYCFDGVCFTESEGSGLRSAVYKYLEDKCYRSGAKEQQLHPWAPTSRRVSDVLDSTKALTHIDGNLDPPFWIPSGHSGHSD